MVFRTEPNIERTQSHLSSGDAHRLRYAALEMRFALERIAYQKLQHRLPEISPKDLAAWQPKRVIETLMELVDPMLGNDYSLHVGMNPGGPVTEDDYKLVGTNKGVDAKSLGKHWHKLGSFLHMTMPSQKGEYPKEPEEGSFRAFLEEVLVYVKDATSTSFDMLMSEKVSFVCRCKQTIVRNGRALKQGAVVTCGNPECDESFITHLKGGAFEFERRIETADCKNCAQPMTIVTNKLLKVKYGSVALLRCLKCGTSHDLMWGYAVELKTPDVANAARAPT